MNFLSLCSGIEAASVAFEPLGWKAVGFAEINPFASAVLAHRYPEVPNFGDITRFREWPEEAFAEADIVVGGPPCQAFSVAGARAGLNDARGNLTLTYAELIDHADDVRTRRGLPPRPRPLRERARNPIRQDQRLRLPPRSPRGRG